MTSGPIFEAGPGWGSRISDWLRENWIYVVPAIAVIVLTVAIFSSRENNQKQPNASQSTILVAVAPSTSFSEIVNKGDSYTTVARRAISLYVATKSDIIAGQLLYAETILAQKINTQPLIIGSIITIPKILIGETLSSLSSLSEYQRLQWAALQKRLRR